MNRRKNVLKEAGVLLITVVMVLSTVIVTGNTMNTSSGGMAGSWYVDVNNGDDSNGGTGWGDAFKTINKAVSMCTQSDFIYVGDGTYYESVSITIPTWITIIGNGTSKTFVEGGSYDAFYVRSEGVMIEKFTIQNSWRGINIHDSDYNHIIYNVIKNNEWGVSVEWATDNVIEENEIISNNQDGINIWELCSDNLVRTNHIESNGGYGVYIHSTSHDNDIYNNYFVNNKNAWDDGANNKWSVPIIPSGTNICGGTGIGGNYWSDYKISGVHPPCPPFNKVQAWHPVYPIPGSAGSVDEHPIPGFELLAFIVALAIALIILKKRR